MWFSIGNDRGVLGMNARNLDYVYPYNSGAAKKFADDKLKTKAFLTARGIPAAKIFARIESRSQLRSFDFSQLPDHCVLKPNYGFGGEGIMLLKGRTKDGHWLRNGKYVFTNAELIEHIEDILDGKYSLGGRKDTAFFEQILTVHDSLRTLRPVGLPDIRILVFNLVPVMAMLRIPTPESDGKANVHLGGIGIGIDIAKGTTTHAVQYNRIIQRLPNGQPAAGMKLAHWDEMLLIASKIQKMTGIGYLAVDLTLDAAMGPALLEVNARPGLMVQVANLAPLKARLERVQGLKVPSPEKGVQIGQDLFGTKVHSEKQSQVPKKPVLGLQEAITVIGDGEKVETTCGINPHAEYTMISPDFFEQIREHVAVQSDTDLVKLKLLLLDTKLQTIAKLAVKPLGNPLMLGRKDLQHFLIDPSKTLRTPAVSVKKSDTRAIDTLFATIDKELALLKYLKPTNLNEELERLQNDKAYNPVFQYAPLGFDPKEIAQRLQKAELDDSPFGILLQKKRTEMLNKVRLLELRGVSTKEFSKVSVELFGKPTSSLVRNAEAIIFNRPQCDMPVPMGEWLTAEQVQERFQGVLDSYGLDTWKVQLRESMVADVTVGGTSIYLRRGATFAPKRVEALIAHEIETHVLCNENGDHQPYKVLRRGLANYLETQEGLATYNQNNVYGPGNDVYYGAARNVLGIEFGLNHSFAEIRHFYETELEYRPEKAISQAVSMKRGIQNTADSGGFTKGLVYFRGWRKIVQFTENGGNLRDLYVGKIALEDLEVVQNLPEIQAPLVLPHWLR